MKVVFFGDSLTAANVSYDWVRQVQKNVRGKKIEAVRLGKNTELVYSALARVPRMIEEKPDLVYVLLGTNDVNACLGPLNAKRYKSSQRLPCDASLEFFKEQLTKLFIEIKRSSSAKIFLISIPILGEMWPSRSNSLAEEFRAASEKIARDLNIGYIPFGERLVEIIKTEVGVRGKDHGEGIATVLKAVFERKILRWSWEKVSKQNGFFLLTDGMHLNETSGHILAEMVQESVLQNIS